MYVEGYYLSSFPGYDIVFTEQRMNDYKVNNLPIYKSGINKEYTIRILAMFIIILVLA